MGLSGYVTSSVEANLDVQHRQYQSLQLDTNLIQLHHLLS
jgi:hypothetical protein